MASIQQRGKNSWLLVVEAGYKADMSRDKVTKTIRVEDKALLKTTKKLQEYLDDELKKFKFEVEAGEYIKPGKMTFAAFVEQWRTKFVEKKLEETSQLNYTFHVNKRILPHFGHLQMEKIKPLHILDYLDDLSEGVGQATIVYNYRVLKSIFTKATELQVIKINPMTGIPKPKETPKEMEVYDESEVALLLQGLESQDFSLRMLVTLALTTGMRRGELLGLEWKHVDLNAGVITIKQTLPIFKNGVPILKEPKNKSSKRKIALPSSVLTELRDYHSYMLRERMKTKVPWQGGDSFFLFANPNGVPMYPKNWGDRWRTFQKNFTGLKYIRFHDLRHTSATLLINQGVHAKLISSRLGHSKITTTMNTYGHIIESADHAAADKLNSIFNSKGKAAQ